MGVIYALTLHTQYCNVQKGQHGQNRCTSKPKLLMKVFLRFQKELQNRLNAQKNEYEAAITRHQNFIDQVERLQFDFVVMKLRHNKLECLSVVSFLQLEPDGGR